MKLIQASIRNFRRLEDVLIEFEESETVSIDSDIQRSL